MAFAQAPAPRLRFRTDALVLIGAFFVGAKRAIDVLAFVFKGRTAVLDGFTAEDDADGHAQDTDQKDTENHCKRKDKQAHGVLIDGFVSGLHSFRSARLIGGVSVAEDTPEDRAQENKSQSESGSFAKAFC